jgi:hypothetical protein
MYLSVDPSTSRFPASDRQLLQEMTTSPEREEALIVAKRRSIEYKMVQNGVNIISDRNLYERTTHIVLGQSLFHVVKKAPDEYRGGITILERTLEIHPLWENTKKTLVKALKDICGRDWKSDNFDSVGGKFF